MKKILSILFFLGVGTAFAQSPAIQWQKSLGGTGRDDAYAIQQTADGGYILAGASTSADGDVKSNHGGGGDCWVVKLDNAGAIVWEKTLGGSGGDLALAVRQTTDGGYIVGGSSQSKDGDVSGNHGNYDYWIVKLTDTGAIQWQKCLGGTQNEFFRSVRQTADGGYIVIGSSLSNDGDLTGNHGNTDIWVVKLTGLGAIQWQKSLGGTRGESGESIQQTTDGGYIITGTSYSNDGDIISSYGFSGDCWVVKLDNTGTLQWQRTLGGTGTDQGFSIQQTPDGGYILAGLSTSTDFDVSGNHGSYDCWVAKLNTMGAIQWQKSLGGTGIEQALAIHPTTDGGYILAGSSQSNDGDVTGNHGLYDCWVVKLNGTGGLQWQKSLGGANGEQAHSIQPTNDGGYILCAPSSSSDGDLTGNQGWADVWVVKLGPDPTAVSDIAITEGISLYPNPADNEFAIRHSEIIRAVAISDVAGKEVYRTGILSSKNIIIPTASLANGVYLVHISTKAGTSTRKLVVQRL